MPDPVHRLLKCVSFSRSIARPAVVAVLCLFTGCAGVGGSTASGSNGTAAPDSASSDGEVVSTAADQSGSGSGQDQDGAAEGREAGEEAGGDSTELCGGMTVSETGRVTNPALSELSGLISSTSEPGLLWAHNDSGNEVVLHGLDTTGAELATVAIAGVAAVDIEDIAISQGQVYLADIGDNDRIRDEIAVHVFAEPASNDSAVEDVRTITLRYPDGAHDAEALLVDPIDGTLAIIVKEIAFGSAADATVIVAAPAAVYTAAPPFSTGEPVELTAAGMVALDGLDRLATGQGPTDGLIAQVGGAGVATGADISADGRVIALRTYETVWLFARGTGQSLVDALAGEPCEAPTITETQGEAVTFLEGSSAAFVTISEGMNPSVNVARNG